MRFCLLFLCVLFLSPLTVLAAPPRSSSAAPGQSATQETSPSVKCVECHAKVTPGVVGDWKQSKHSGVGVGWATPLQPCPWRQ